MKYLLISRHAKSPWNNFNVSDHDRELNSEGIEDASMMGERLLSKGISFDLMLTSSATRALTTCQLIASKISYPLYEIRVEKEIYSSNSNSLKNIISKIDSNIDSLAIFGHNPTLHAISEELKRGAIDRFPTCSMTYFKFKTKDWKEFMTCDRKIIFFDYPKNEEKS